MEILNTKAVLALGLSGALSVGNAATSTTTEKTVSDRQIISVSSPDVRVTVYDGIATVFGNAVSSEEAIAMEHEILDVPGVDYVINLITWQ